MTFFFFIAVACGCSWGVCKRNGILALRAILTTLRLYAGGRPGSWKARTGIYSAATGWGVSRPLSADPSSPFCSDPGSGFSRACRVSACHSCTRSVGVFPAWGNQEEIWSLLRSLSQKVPHLYQWPPAGSNWQCLEASLVMTTWGSGGTSGILSRGQGCCSNIL